MFSNLSFTVIRIIGIWYESFRIWINTPPKSSDMFFTNIRKLKQQLFPCKHEYAKVREFHRQCTICGDYQIMMYHRYGEKRTSWQSFPLDNRELP